MRKMFFKFAGSWMLAVVLVPAVAWADEVAEMKVESVVLRPLQEAEVPARRTGLLESIVVLEGQRVERGQLLAELDGRAAVLESEQAILEVAGAQAKATSQIHIQYAVKALEVAQAELQRSEESIRKFARSVSQSQLDVERLTVEKLTLERQQAEHEMELEGFSFQLKQSLLKAAQLNVQQHTIRAPFAGTVVLVRGRVGEWVELGAPLLRLVSVTRLRAEGFLPAEVASDKLIGRNVRFVAVASKDTPQIFNGTLRFVSPEMDPVTRQVRVWAEIENPEGRLRPGESGTLEILAAARFSEEVVEAD